MKLKQKLNTWAGLILIASFAYVVLLFGGHAKASALTTSDWSGATYSLAGSSTITANMSNGTSVTFTANSVGSPIVFTTPVTPVAGASICAGSSISMPSAVSPTGTIDVKWINTATGETCSSSMPLPRIFSYKGTVQISVAGVPGGTTAGGGAATCESSSFTSFEWLLCPILRLFDTMADTFNKILSNLLDFETSVYLNAQVKSTWSIMRTISSALLVVIMLIAVISQAIGGGPVDAYTLRKILPRLVAAVILIQISWVMLIWFINIANDLGHGVRDLISAPFGGWQNLELSNLFASLGFTGTATTTAIFTGLVVAVWLSGISIGGILLLGLGAVLTDFVAFIFLVLRQVFVVLSVILFPIALLAWILPGTQRYWKLWSDNFMKLLLLFPMIMGIVYGGRIFAHIFIEVNANGGTLNKIIAVFVLFIGFFGPYWFIPKAFKWGGQIFSAASAGAFNATQGLRQAPGKFARSQASANRQQRSTDRNERLSYNKGRRFDRLFAAAGGFGLSARSTETRQSRQRAEGREAGEKAVAQSIVGSSYESEDHPDKLKTLTLLAQGQFDPKTGLDGKNPAMQRFAMDQLATFGDWDIIDGLRTSKSVDERTWQAFVAKNISGIHQNAPFLSPIRRDMSALGYQEFATWKDHSFHEYERQVSNGLIRTADGTGWEFSKNPAKQRAEAIKKANDALGDERVRANLSTDAVEVLTRISKMDAPDDTPEVSVARSPRGGPARVILPSGTTVQASPEARQNLTRALISPNPEDRDNRPAIISTIATRLANPNTPTADPNRQGMEDYLRQLSEQAAASGSPEAKESYNSILQAIGSQLAGWSKQAETEALAAGKQGPMVVQEREAAQAKAEAEWQRLQNAGLRPLP